MYLSLLYHFIVKNRINFKFKVHLFIIYNYYLKTKTTKNSKKLLGKDTELKIEIIENFSKRRDYKWQGYLTQTRISP